MRQLALVWLAATLAAVGIAITPAAATPMPASATATPTMAGRPASYPLRCQVTANNVNYRRGPGKQYASFGQLNRGFRFASGGGVRNPRGHLQYWDTIRRSGHADAYIDDAYVYCRLA
ncbi:MAG TPA: hypothetical protein VFX16_34705 [Pseudonocardiaceae bacterium]|nr:hypothetical protein [Pseudonocardiaceae bacterium]